MGRKGEVWCSSRSPEDPRALHGHGAHPVHHQGHWGEGGAGEPEEARAEQILKLAGPGVNPIKAVQTMGRIGVMLTTYERALTHLASASRWIIFTVWDHRKEVVFRKFHRGVVIDEIHNITSDRGFRLDTSVLLARAHGFPALLLSGTLNDYVRTQLQQAYQAGLYRLGTLSTLTGLAIPELLVTSSGTSRSTP